jgi:diguanylate cyclase (GGDEF)-like protein
MANDHIDPLLLAIDDSDLIHRLLRARLKHEQIQIHCAGDGPTGLSMARALQPDVILLDIEMPGMDGFAVLEQLKSDPVTMEIPVIVLSSTEDTDCKVRGLDMGAIDFVTKPFDLAELRARVRTALRTHRLIMLLAQRAQIDGMTGLWNRAYLDERLAQEMSTAIRHDRPLSFMLCDLDHFKKVNDNYGHPVGDRVLEEFARILNRARQSDVACRYGGEEFGLIMPNTAAMDAAVVAERVRVQTEHMHVSGLPDLAITVSMGIADFSCLAEPTVGALIAAADDALYDAKHAGRNRVIIANPDPATALRHSA